MSIKTQDSNYPLAYLDEENEQDLRNSSEDVTSNEEESSDDESSESKDELRLNPRFQKVIKNWRKTEQELATVRQHSDELFQKVSALEKAQTDSTQNVSSNESPDYWSELYETKEQANAAWKVMNKALESREAKLRDEIKQETQNVFNAESQAQSKWEQHISEQLNHLEEVFPDLDATSNSAKAKNLRAGIRKVWEEYSPKNEDGDYVFIPIEKAYDILQKENQLEKAPKDNARKSLAGLSTARSFPGEAPLNVRPAPTNNVKNTSKFGRLPWRSQLSSNE
jgi:hypothetical protein